MASEIRAVLDTSVLVSAVLGPHGTSREILRRGMGLEFIWIVSDVILEEYRGVLKHSKIASKVTLSEEVLKALDELLEGFKKRVVRRIRVVRDPADDIFVECAAEHRAHYIVSLDQDLLVLQNFGEIKIVNAFEFLKILRKE